MQKKIFSLFEALCMFFYTLETPSAAQGGSTEHQFNFALRKQCGGFQDEETQTIFRFFRYHPRSKVMMEDNFPEDLRLKVNEQLISCPSKAAPILYQPKFWYKHNNQVEIAWTAGNFNREYLLVLMKVKKPAVPSSQQPEMVDLTEPEVSSSRQPEVVDLTETEVPSSRQPEVVVLTERRLPAKRPLDATLKFHRHLPGKSPFSKEGTRAKS